MRRPAHEILCLTLIALLWGCQPAQDTASEEADDQAATETPAAPEILPQPFTAEQIRDEWVPGFQLKMSRRTSEALELERWTVVAADDEGAEIEYATLEESGAVVGEPRVDRTLWTELRDHASFPAQQATREEATRTTELGELDGWLYTVTDPEAGTVTEFFFAKDLPGAPVAFSMRTGDLVVMELRQLERFRPDPSAPEESAP